jgi:protein-tyrosine phosphatase
MTNRVLFLCSGNYYRSRFAEYLFNSLAESSGLAWGADSRGLCVGCADNIGPISRYAIERLHALGISINSPRFPSQVEELDLAGSALVIALKEAEHRPMVARMFPTWENRVEYWHIDDLDCAEPEDALSALEDEIRSLVGRLEQDGECKAVSKTGHLPVHFSAEMHGQPAVI